MTPPPTTLPAPEPYRPIPHKPWINRGLRIVVRNGVYHVRETSSIRWPWI